MPTSAVVDASVLVSAFLFPESVPGRVLRLAEQGASAQLIRLADLVQLALPTRIRERDP